MAILPSILTASDPAPQMAAATGTTTVSMVNTFHPDYQSKAMDWMRMNMLYEGGYLLKLIADQFLQRRPKELPEVYQNRLDKFSYHNILGTCFGWYHASLFKSPPIVRLGLQDPKTGKTTEQLPEDQALFYNEFRKNCDRCRTSLTDLTRDLWTNLSLFGAGWVLVDKPGKDEAVAGSLFDQKQAGLVDRSGKPVPHLVSYSPLDVINWSADRYGILEWAVLRTQEYRGGFLSKREIVDTWWYFDRTNFIRYERVRKDKEDTWAQIGDDSLVQQVDQGPHALADAKLVPLLNFTVPSALWLANRAYLPIVDHLNADNAYGWALFMANLAMPVIISDDEVQPTLSEAGFIKLRAGSEYKWTEPIGNSFVHASNRVEELRQECFRLMYLIYQGRTANATADGASGSSKQMDMMPAQDVMNEYGDVIVSATQRILDMVALARGDNDVRADVRGMKFGKTATLEQIEKTMAVLALAIPSDIFTKQVYAQAAAEFLPDANPELLEQIIEEIMKSPSTEVQRQMALSQQLQQYASAFDGKTANFSMNTKPAIPNTVPRAVPRTSSATLLNS